MIILGDALNIQQQSVSVSSLSFITDICVVKEGEPQMGSSDSVTLNDVSDLNFGCSAKTIHLCVRRGSDNPPLLMYLWFMS